MPKIVPIIEGPGEVEAVPALLQKILVKMERWEISVSEPKNAHGCGNITDSDCLERFIRLSTHVRDCGAVLVLMDADKNCPVELARNLADRARAMQASVPIVIVVANCEYEAWFLASLETIAGQTWGDGPGIPATVRYNDDPDSIVGAKGWITRQLPPGHSYKPTFDQLPMTRLIDTEIARRNSRSFRRLWHAVEEAVAAIDAKTTVITPVIQIKSEA